MKLLSNLLSWVQLDNLMGNPSVEGGANPINHLTGAFCADYGLWCLDLIYGSSWLRAEIVTLKNGENLMYWIHQQIHSDTSKDFEMLQSQTEQSFRS